MITTAVGTTLMVLSINDGETHLDGWSFNLNGRGEHDHLFTITDNEVKAGAEYITPGVKTIWVAATHNIYPDQLTILQLTITDDGRISPLGTTLYSPPGHLPVLGSTYEIFVSHKFAYPIVYPVVLGGPYSDTELAVITINDEPIIIHKPNGQIEMRSLTGRPPLEVAPGTVQGDGWFVLRMVREDRGSGLTTYIEFNGVLIHQEVTDLLVDIVKFEPGTIISGTTETKVVNVSVAIDGVVYISEELNPEKGIFFEEVV